MDRFLQTVEESAIFRLLSGLNAGLWQLWEGSAVGRAFEALGAWIRHSYIASLFVGRAFGSNSAIAGYLRTRIGTEGELAPAQRWERMLLYFVVLFVPIELWLITWLPSEIKYLGDAAVVLLLLSVAIRLNRTGWPLRRTPADLPVILLLGVALVSTLWNFVPLHIAFFGTRAYLEYYALYLAIAYIPFADADRRQLIIWFLVLAGAIALFGDAQKFLHVATPRQWLSAAEAATTRSFGTMDNPNTFGGFLMLTLSLLTAMLFTKVRGGLRVLALIGIAIGVPALLFTLSREALLAFGAAALIIAVVADRRFLLVLVAGVVLLPIVDPHLLTRFTFALSSNYLAASSSYGRLLFWSKGLQAFLQSPLIGWGPGRFGGSVAHLYGSPVYVLLGLGYNPIIDSQHIQTLVELGAIGYIAYLWLGIAAVRAGLRLYRQDLDPFWRALGLGLAAGAVGLYIQSFFASLLETHQVIIVFWLLFGMVAWRLRTAIAAQRGETSGVS
ncbi:MAG: O-antigen ligase family protein [Thermaerobacter sp.]|nr:O-antigen ligase family protein [Thermaerobacter sp.]